MRVRIARFRNAQIQQNGKAEQGVKELVTFKGHTAHRSVIKVVETLTDEDLAKLNSALEWKCFVVDSRGRRFGDAAWQGKRCEPQAVPDERILLLNERFDLADKHVLELGCFEGIHTVGLSMFARQVTAVDARIENVLKSIVRCAMFGYHPTIFQCDVESRPLPYDDLACDVLHHVGVLYHLKDPVTHLLELQRFVRLGVMVDTHYANESEATDLYEVNGRSFKYRRYLEYGQDDPFSGMSDQSKWLRLEDLTGLLEEAGFNDIEVVEKRAERNGPRVLLLARRK